MRTLILSSGLLAAALMAAPHAAFAQAQEKAYCLESPTGARNCIYESFEQCQQVQGGRSVGGGCVANPARSGTTGAGGGGQPNMQPNMQPPGGGGGQQLPPPGR
jgi:Protein of unknown function (DUF3551)